MSTTNPTTYSIVLLPVADEKELAPAIDLLAGIVLRAKVNTELVVCITPALQKAWENAAKNKQPAELAGKNKLREIACATEHAAQALQAALPQLHTEWVYIYHNKVAAAASHAVNWFAQQKETTADVYWTVPAETKSELSTGQKLLRGLFNLFNGLSSGAAMHDYTCGGILLKKSAVDVIFPQLASKDENIFTELLTKSKFNGFKLERAEMALKTNPFKNYAWGKMAGEAFRQIFSTRWDWYVTQPMADLKSSTLSIWDSEHSIYRFSFFIIFVLALIGMPVLSFDFGVTWDEKAQMGYGYDMLKYFTSFGEDKSVFDETKPLYSHLKYYGSFFDFFAAFIEEYISPWDKFETRHLINSLFGLMAMVYAALCAREIGNWRTATFALLLILITPQFFGQSMNNPKDIPFAAGYIFAMYHMIRFLKQLPDPRKGTILFLICGIALTNSMRIGGLILLVYLGMFMGLVWLWQMKKVGTKQAFSYVGKYAKYFFVIAGCSYFLGILFWPFGISKPFTNPLLALKEFTNFTLLTSYEIFEGVRTYMAQVPWYYTIKYIGITVPVVALAGMALGVLLIVFVRKKYNLWFVLMLLFVVAFPVGYAAYKSSMLYNGWRHFLFVYPPLVAIAATGWDALANLFKVTAVKIVVTIVVLTGLAEPLAFMVRNHPHEYIYFNQLVGGIKGAYGNYETDYYGNCIKAATEWLIKNEPVLNNKQIIVAINNEPLNASYYGQKFSDSLAFAWTREQEWYRSNWDYAIYTSRTLTPEQIRSGQFPPKESIHVIEVDGVPLAAILKKQNDYIPRAFGYLQRNLPDSAIPLLEQAIAYNPKNEEAYRLLGSALVNTRQDVKAKETLNKAITLLPENYEAYDLMGLIDFNNQRYKEAIELFKKAYGFKVNFPSAYYHAAISYMNLGQYQDAVKHFELCVEENGNMAEVYVPMGQAYLLVGDYKKAVDAENNALNLNPNLPQAWQIMGDAFNRMGDTQNAQQCMQRAAQLQGGNPQ